MTKVSIFLPIYNEEKILGKNVNKLIKHLNYLDYELFLVNDCSIDNTGGVCEELIKEDNKIHYIEYLGNPSIRENLAKSFKYAKGDIVVFMDLDLAVDLKHLKELVGYVEEGYDISTGSRYLGIESKRRLDRKIISQVYRYMIKFMFNSRVEDHQCGFKAFKKNIILGLVDDMGYNLKRGWLWDTELLIRAQERKYRIKEFPVVWEQGVYSSFSLRRDIIKGLLYIISLRCRIILI